MKRINVGELKEIIKDLPDDAEIVMTFDDDDDNEYCSSLSYTYYADYDNTLWLE